ncbi:hypothetical protein PL2TA16_04202, partial [Pseudoalteromonas luteoviolacea 2ta16]
VHLDQLGIFQEDGFGLDAKRFHHCHIDDWLALSVAGDGNLGYRGPAHGLEQHFSRGESLLLSVLGHPAQHPASNIILVVTNNWFGKRADKNGHNLFIGKEGAVVVRCSVHGRHKQNIAHRAQFPG